MSKKFTKSPKPFHSQKTSKWRQYLLPFLLPLAFGFLVMLLGRGLWLEQKTAPSPLLNKPMPVLNLPVLNATSGQVNKNRTTINYGADNNITVLNIFASWCVPCRAEVPALDLLKKTSDNLKSNSQSPYQLTLIAINWKDKPSDARQFLQELGNPFQNIYVDREGESTTKLGLLGVPETYIIDSQGILRYKKTGPLTLQEVEQQLLPFIAGLVKK